MDIHITPKQIKIISNKKVVKETDIDTETFKQCMNDLIPDEMLDTVRGYSKKFRGKSFIFKEVKV